MGPIRIGFPYASVSVEIAHDNGNMGVPRIAAQTGDIPFDIPVTKKNQITIPQRIKRIVDVHGIRIMSGF